MSTNRQQVVDYFEGTRWDYRHLWRSERAGALHFGFYDQGIRDHVTALRRMTGYLASVARIGPQDRIMDAGCGIGGCAIRIAERFGCRATGVNITPFQVTQAREAARRAGVDDLVEFVEADFTDTGLPDASHTVVWALESVVHVDDKEAFVREAHRVLAPGGRLMIAEYLVREDPAPAPADEEELRTWCEGWAMPGLLTGTEYERLLRKQGFEDVRITDISHHVAPSLKRLGRLVRLLGPTAPAFRRLGVLAPVPAGNLSASAAQIRMFDAGVWRYKVVTARKPGGDTDPTGRTPAPSAS
ncbi:methyltransferase domain-containing protein [Streptomyces pilosus]|uniref:Type 11 methyltransferase n=1 Tax=Streptomyces pilosus TaxID=28893 RepID=A0A918BJR6_9ACTN|nr:methyltransferase domain-containing protein [Streptomyces pilosus]GGQ73928.1 type 11 methyltransferase [Streptomyces pilosus]GGV61246.1 type 11 methyltransferase [Streptomyces pilosus]